MNRLTAVIFDFDGLIADTESPEYDSVAEAFVRHGVEFTIDEWQHIVGTDSWFDWLGELQARAAGPVDPERVTAEREARRAELVAAVKLCPGVVDRLDEAARLGVGVAVASSSPSSWVNGHLERFGLRHHFVAVHGREHVAEAKPAPDLFRLATESLGADPAETIALEDSHHGVTAARAAGLACVAVPNRITRGQAFDHANLVVDSLSEVTLAGLATQL